MCQFPPPDDYFRPSPQPPRACWRWSVIGLLAALLAFALLAGCGTFMPADPLTRPTVIQSDRTPPRVKVFRQCDEHGCRLYDRYGMRRYDCEREWSTCDRY